MKAISVAVSETLLAGAPFAPYAAPPTREQEVEVLRDQAEWLKEQLEAIGKRIAELEQEQ